MVVTAGASAQQPGEDDSAVEVRTTVDKGVVAFKAARYEEAASNFRGATQLDPTNENAHLYLGTAYAVQVVPNLLTPENSQIAESALTEFDVVLKVHPGEVIAMKQEAAIYRNLQRYDQAMDMERKIAAIEPNGAEAFYIMGFVDWKRAYDNAIQALIQDGLTDDGEGNARMTRAACVKLRAQNMPLVEDGIANLTRAIELNPNYSDAMQYLQLTYRLHADFACGDKAVRNADLELADQWAQKAIGIRKQAQTLPQK
jgi:tetratricopeptide (TPR) repeat protein